MSELDQICDEVMSNVQRCWTETGGVPRVFHVYHGDGEHADVMMMDPAISPEEARSIIRRYTRKVEAFAVALVSEAVAIHQKTGQVVDGVMVIVESQVGSRCFFWTVDSERELRLMKKYIPQEGMTGWLDPSLIVN